jgi:transposase
MKSIAATVYAGVDVAKATLQAHIQGHQHAFENTPAGHRKLCRQLQRVPGVQVVCEATGGYESALVGALHQATIPVAVINPARARAAAKASGQHAKSDPIDAAQLTDFGDRYKPAPTPEVSAVQRQLSQLASWLDQLIRVRALVKGLGEHLEHAFARKQHQALLDFQEQKIQAVEAQIRKLQSQDQELNRRLERLDAIDGVGWRTGVMVLARMPELGSLNRQRVAALAGLAPWMCDSGVLKGQRHIRGGRHDLRRALYMAALSAIRCNPVLKPLYEQLRSRGKQAKVALTAVMRRLLTYMNQVLKPTPAELPIASEKC